MINVDAIGHLVLERNSLSTKKLLKYLGRR